MLYPVIDVEEVLPPAGVTWFHESLRPLLPHGSRAQERPQEVYHHDTEETRSEAHPSEGNVLEEVQLTLRFDQHRMDDVRNNDPTVRETWSGVEIFMPSRMMITSGRRTFPPKASR